MLAYKFKLARSRPLWSMASRSNFAAKVTFPRTDEVGEMKVPKMREHIASLEDHLTKKTGFQQKILRQCLFPQRVGVGMSKQDYINRLQAYIEYNRQIQELGLRKAKKQITDIAGPVKKAQPKAKSESKPKSVKKKAPVALKIDLPTVESMSAYSTGRN